MNKKLSIISMLTLGLVSTYSLYAADQIDLTLKDKLSYSLGIKAGRSLARDLVSQNLAKSDIEVEMLLKGIQDGWAENKPLVSETELRNAFIEFQTQTHQRETALQQLKMIAALLFNYRLDTGEYPASLEELANNVNNHKYWHGPYVSDSKVLVDPWNHPYQYRYPSLNKNYGLNHFDLFSWGMDGAEGGAAENADLIWEAPSNSSAIDPTSSLELGDATSSTITAKVVAEDISPADKKKYKSLVIEYQRDSWTRVVDSRGKELFAGIAKGGKNLSVNGIPPFDLRFGVTMGITLKYEGESFILEEHPDLKNGRLSIGESVSDE